MLTDQQLDEIIASKGMKPYNPASSGGGGLRGQALVDSLKQRNTQSTNQPINQPTTTSSEKQDGFFKGLAKSIAKPFAETATSGYNTLAAAGNLLSGDVEGADKALEAKRDLPFMGETKPSFTGKEGFGEGVKKMAGYGAEMASTVAPVGKIGLGAKALAKGAGRMALQAGVGTAGRELEDKGTIDPTEVAKSAAIGAAIPVGLRGVSSAGKTVLKAAGEALGGTTGAGSASIMEAFKNPNVMKFARSASEEGGASSLQRQALEDAHKGLKQIIEKRGTKYRADLERVTKETPMPRNAIGEHPMEIVVNSARDKARKLMDEYGLNTVVDEVGKPIDLGFDGSTITQNKEVVKKALKDVLYWQENTPAGLDKLKKRLSQFKKDIPSSETGGAKNFIQQLHDSVSDGLKEQVPGYREMTKSYSEASDLIDEVESTLSLKDTTKEETAVKKLMSSMRDNNELRKDFVDLLSAESGQDITAKMAGSQLASIAPKGLAKTLFGPGLAAGGTASALSPSSIPMLVTYIAASSPRLMGELTNVLGQVSKPAIKANQFSAPVRNKLLNLLQQTLSQENEN